MDSECKLCKHLYIQDFDLDPEGPSLLNRLNFENLDSVPKRLKKIKKDVLILLGNGTFAKSIPDAVDKLAVRNYPDLFGSSFDGNRRIQVFVPDFYLTKVSLTT